ncbi:DUF417 family protein [Pedobacter sp. Bi126]|uniref:DUF417 family protein n=1 Tax=unclassified Pedobacter TaxID=2628915 RepID=UPI00353003EF
MRLGLFLIITGIFVGLYRFTPLCSMIACLLVFLMTVGTLSFLIITPESWVPWIMIRTGVFRIYPVAEDWSLKTF